LALISVFHFLLYRCRAAGVISPDNQQSGKVDMKTDVLNETTASTDIRKIKMGLFRFRGSPVWKSSFTLRLAAWLFPTIDTARLVLIHQKFSKLIS
jgi:hypothetical protein